MAFVGSGREALRFLEEHAADIVVSDMRMPEMDGAELLACVRDRQPDAIRFVLSGQSSRDASVRAAHLTHQFLPKPIEMAVLERVLARALTLRELLADPELRALVDELEPLPAVPEPYLDLMRGMGDGQVTLAGVTAMVEPDPILCGKILQVANSAFFGLPQATSSIGKAVSYLGIDVVRALVLATGLYRDAARVPEGLDLADDQAHALAVAVLARGVAGTRTGLDAAFAAGLLHDVGKLAVGPGHPRHPSLGAYMVGMWGLPQQVVEAVAYHHSPRSAPRPSLDAVAAVHIADALVREREEQVRGRPPTAGAAPLDEAYLAAIGVEFQMEGWRRAAAGLMPDGAHLREAATSETAGQSLF